MLDVNKWKAVLATRTGPSLSLLGDRFPDTGIHPATQELHQFRGDALGMTSDGLSLQYPSLLYTRIS